ncbi:MAG TPA: Rieske 2Fe-2S domain-containing protein [Dermatophilaceae bacterium]|nr:Rieske 2Fe-2S domain-containing protein [Dermatophilaceae bacterium]
MSEHDTPRPGDAVPAGPTRPDGTSGTSGTPVVADTNATGTGTGTEAVLLDDGHPGAQVGIPEHFENPGLPPHIPRTADLSEQGAQRAERQVVALFALSILATVVFVLGYLFIDTATVAFVPGIGDTRLSNIVLGTSMAVGLLGIGFGAVHWAKTLMPDEEVVEMRHPLRSSDESRAAFGATMRHGAESSGLARRPMIKYTLGGALGLVLVPTVLPLIGGLGPMPGNYLSTTFWDGPEGEDGTTTFTPLRLVRDPENTPVKADDVTIGSVFHIQPEGLLDLDHGVLEAKAKASVILIRLDPEEIQSQKQRDWGYQGIVAYSKICTHVGCPVGLYEQQTHHLLCPCHQSTFDVTQDAKVIFGPAKRALPQLKITVDDEGYLVSAQPFQEAVGPSFWERNS